MLAQTDTTAPLVSTLVPEGLRLRFLPKHFGRLMLIVESRVYTAMRSLCPDYTGGYWEYREVSNGAAYLALKSDATQRLVVEGNGFVGEMGADAAGIIATLFALNTVIWQLQHDAKAQESLTDHYYWLRDYAAVHPESALILRAID